MTNKDYQNLRSKIIEAVPDILELKFGCWIYINWDDKKGRVMLYSKPDKDGFMDWACGVLNLKREQKDKRFKIIGRDIKLADVLIAIPDEKNIYISNRTGLFSVWSRALNEMVSQHINWNLQNNSLEWHWKNQKETVEFLFNLLV